ncbi:hypothetical protein E3N88_22959 [Mikania micrantha]|uniref:BED-type domain-containing protein n=1 Tax=Mikania micrantha TaxID=192012 RepID=A0A5N6NEF8_9ASTR|nr:hypothetical protein E3N88_22959 [Mikania micrantha]
MANQEAKNQELSTLEEPPLWDYVSKIEKQGGGVTWKFKCNLCSEIRHGSYSRVRAHLLGYGISFFKKATAGDKLEMKRLEDAHEEKKAESKSIEVELPCESGVGFKKRKGLSEPLQRCRAMAIVAPRPSRPGQGRDDWADLAGSQSPVTQLRDLHLVNMSYTICGFATEANMLPPAISIQDMAMLFSLFCTVPTSSRGGHTACNSGACQAQIMERLVLEQLLEVLQVAEIGSFVVLMASKASLLFLRSSITKKWPQ